MKRKTPWGLDSINRTMAADPFQGRKKAYEQEGALRNAKKAGDSFGALKKVVRAVAGDLNSSERMRNAMQQAEGGIRPPQSRLDALTPQQRRIVMRELNSHRKR